MNIEFDPLKDQVNRVKHGLSLEAARDMDFDSALKFTDERHAYGEIRWLAIGPISGRLHVLVYTVRGAIVRAISLRKANERERTRYERAA